MLRKIVKYIKKFSAEEQTVLSDYFSRTQRYYAGNGDSAAFMRDDLNALEALIARGIPVAEAVSLLSVRMDCDFFQKSGRAYPLDTAAKLYPLVMGRYASSIFRLSAWLKEDVCPQILQSALDRVEPRFPCFFAVLKNGLFWHYLDGYNGHCRIERDGDVPCYQMRMSGAKSVPFRVVYYKNRIGVEFFHALTDGTGGLIFLKTLLGEYFRLLGVSFQYGEDVLDICEQPNTEELADGFMQIQSSLPAGGMEEHGAVPLDGKISYRRSRVYHFVFDADALKLRAKARGVTVTALCTGYVLRAAKECSHGEGLFRIQLPINARKFYGLKTLTNCAMFTCVEMERGKVVDNDSLLTRIDAQIKERAGKENVERSIVKACGMVRLLGKVPLFLKRPAAKAYNLVVTKRAFTQTFSNLGVVRLPEGISERVDMLDFIIGAPSKNTGYLSMITYNGQAVLTYTTSNTSRRFEEELCKIASSDGLVAKIYGGQNYEG